VSSSPLFRKSIPTADIDASATIGMARIKPKITGSIHSRSAADTLNAAIANAAPTTVGKAYCRARSPNGASAWVRRCADQPESRPIRISVTAFD
jgi:hypothetical protein